MKESQVRQKDSPIKNIYSITILSAALAMSIASAATAVDHAPTYKLARSVSLPGTEGWDYLTADSQSHRLYIARSSRVTVFDLQRGKVIGDISGLSGAHGVAIDAAAHRGYITAGRTSEVVVFDTKTLSVLSKIPVGTGPDAIVFEPSSHRVFSFNGRAGTATAIDTRSGRVVGTVKLPGRPEFAVAGPGGYVYDNIEDANEIVRINAQSLKIDKTMPLNGGTGPSGLAIDPAHNLLFSVCDNREMKVVDAGTGKVVSTLTIGGGPDACVFDQNSGLAFSPNGEDGNITVARELSPTSVVDVASFPTRAGARTVALDSATHRIYTVTATEVPAPPGEAKGEWYRPRHYATGSFTILEYAP